MAKVLIIDFSPVDYTSHIIYQLEEYYGEAVLCGGLPDAVICASLDVSLIGELRTRWRASKGDTFRERILYMIAGPIESLGLKVVKSRDLESSKLISQLEAVKRNVVIDYGEFGMQLPDADIILYSPEDSQVVAIGRELKHSVINHSEQFVDGDTHTNTIEGFWSLLKRAWYGSHHHYQTGYTPLYVAEQCYKYNYRETDIFWKFIRESVK